MNAQKELIIRNGIQLHRLEKLYLNNESHFHDIVSYMPLLVTVSYVHSLDYKFCNDAVEDMIHLDKGFILEHGWSFIRNHIHPENLKYQAVVLNRFRKQDGGSPLSYFQYVRKAGERHHYWVHTYKKFLTDDLYISVYYDLNLLGKAASVIDQYLGRIALSEKAYLKYQSLTRREKEILNLVADGLTNREISDALFISELTVKTHRKNLSHKLDLKNLASTIRFANAVQFLE